ncbi:MAG: DUF2141 domain-containing protein [Duganella sp.]
MKQFLKMAVMAAVIGSSSVGAAQAADLTVEVTGLTNPNAQGTKGQVLVAVYNRAEDFLKKPMRATAAANNGGAVRVVVADLPPGDYALSVFLDANGNGKLDTNPIGMPLEPYGFSNDASGNYGPPSFKAATVQLPAGGALTTVTLR